MIAESSLESRLAVATDSVTSGLSCSLSIDHQLLSQRVTAVLQHLNLLASRCQSTMSQASREKNRSGSFENKFTHALITAPMTYKAVSVRNVMVLCEMNTKQDDDA